MSGVAYHPVARSVHQVSCRRSAWPTDNTVHHTAAGGVYCCRSIGLAADLEY